MARLRPFCNVGLTQWQLCILATAGVLNSVLIGVLLDQEQKFKAGHILGDVSESFLNQLSISLAQAEQNSALLAHAIELHDSLGTKAQKFRTLVNDLLLYQSWASAMGYSQVTYPSEESNLIAEMHQCGYLGFRLRHPPGATLTPHEYRVIVKFITPPRLEDNLLGLDMSQDSTQQTALLKARDTGSVSITRPLKLLPGDDNSLKSFMYFAPVYNRSDCLQQEHDRCVNVTVSNSISSCKPSVEQTIEWRRSNIIGYTYMSFSIPNMLEQFSFHDAWVRLFLYEVDDSGKPVLLYSVEHVQNADGSVWRILNISQKELMDIDPTSEDQWRRNMVFNIGEIELILYVEATNDFIQEHISFLPWVSMSIALAATLIGCFFLWRLQRQRHQSFNINTLIRVMPDPMVVFRASGDQKIVLCSASLFAATGFNSEQLMGKNISILFRDLDSVIDKDGNIDQVAASMQLLKVKATHNNCISCFPVDAAFARTKDGDIICIFRDITNSLQREKALIESKKAAEHAHSIKSNFLAYVCHEIRNPLHAIMGMLSLLRKSQLNPNEIALLDAADESSLQMSHIVNDVLDLTKIKRGNFQLESTKVDLHELVHKIDTTYSYDTSEQKVKWSTHIDDDIPHGLMGDPIRLMQIMSNLVSNAVKFCKKGSIQFRVSRVIDADEDEAEHNADVVHICIAVLDTGIGIAADVLPMIGSEFQQATTSTAREYGGSGLGVSIIKSIAEKMGGRLEIKSELGKGSEFRVFVPLIRANGLSRLQKRRLSSTLESISTVSSMAQIHKRDFPLNLNILLVEDVLINQKLVRAFLQTSEEIGAHIDLSIANNGLEAVNLVVSGDEAIENESKEVHSNRSGRKESKYDLILMDISMPIMDGIEASRRIRTAGFTAPIVGLTGNATKECRNAYLDVFDMYQTKPFTCDQLFSVILKAIHLRTEIQHKWESKLTTAPPQMHVVSETSTNSESHLVHETINHAGGGIWKETTVEFHGIPKADTDTDEGDAGTRSTANLPGTAYDIHLDK